MTCRPSASLKAQKVGGRVRALLLDFDGTLANTIPMLFRTYMKFLSALGARGSREEFDRLNGYGLEEVMHHLKRTHDLSVDPMVMWKKYQVGLRSDYANSVELFEGTRPFLEGAHGMGLRLAVVSSASEELVHSALKRLSVDALFEQVITPEGLQRSKPDPAIYQKALSTMKLQAHEALAVEDSSHGCAAALAAEIPTIALIHDGGEATLPTGILASCHSWEEVWELVSSDQA